jgi:hypothetical protein
MHPGNVLSRVTEVVLMVDAVRTATTNGTGVDITDYEGVGLIVLTSTAEASTGTMDLVIQDSPDNSVWTTIPNLYNLGVPTGATHFAQVTNAGTSDQIRAIDVQGANKFIRAVQTVGGGSPSANAAVLFLGIKKVASA